MLLRERKRIAALIMAVVLCITTAFFVPSDVLASDVATPTDAVVVVEDETSTELIIEDSTEATTEEMLATSTALSEVTTEITAEVSTEASTEATAESTTEVAIEYDFSWMDIYSDDIFFEISGLTKEEWKIDYPDLTFEDFMGDSLSTYVAGVGYGYNLAPVVSILCQNAVHPAVGTMTNNVMYPSATGSLVICCTYNLPSAFEWAPYYIEENVEWNILGTYQTCSSYRDIFFNLFQGAYPSYDNAMNIYTSQGVGMAGFDSLTQTLTANGSNNVSTAPDASAFKITKADGSIISSNLNITTSATEQKTETLTAHTGTSYIYANVSFPSGVTLHYQMSDGNWDTIANNTGANKTQLVSDGKQFYFTVPLTRSNIDSISISAARVFGDTAYYINDVHLLVPGNQLYDSGSYKTLQTFAYPVASTPGVVTASIPWVGKGKISIKKVSSNTSITDGNSCYSLAGAKFGVYNTRADATNNTNVIATITTDANGEGSATDLPLDTYYIKELVAPKGYILSRIIYTAEVNSPTVPVNLTITNTPGNDPVRILVQKVDAQGARLQGAEFTIKYYDIQQNTDSPVDPATLGEAPIRSWVLRSDEYGEVQLREEHKVSGDDFYLYLGQPTIPIGTITIQETKAPEGYVIDPTIRVQSVAPGTPLENENYYNTSTIPNTIMKQPFAIKKYGVLADGTSYELAGARFMVAPVDELALDNEGNYVWDESKAIVVSPNGSKIMVTDESGYAESIALEYGKFLVHEVEAPEHHILCDDFIVNIETNSTTPEVYMAYDFYNPPEIGTTAKDKATDSHVGTVGEKVTIIDTVECKNLIVGKEYSLNGLLMKKESKQPFKDNGAEVTATKTFTATASNMSLDMEFTFDSTSLAGKSVVVFEELYYEGVEIATHNDLEDEGQTVDYPSIGTTAKDKATDSHVGTVGEKVTIIDTVECKNLIVGKKYTLNGLVMDKESKQPFKDNGAEVTATKTFTATASNMSVDMEFTFNSTSLAGKSVVVFEDLYYEGVEVATHNDLEDEGQTITFPPETPPVETPPVETPPTGDGAPIGIVVGLLVLAVAGLITVINLKKLPKKIK